MSWLTSLKRALSQKNPPDPPINIADSGFSFVSAKGKPVHVLWADVVQIRAFKLDLLTFDEVRFIFILTSGLAVEISEEQPGFNAALSAAIIHFPSLADWQDHIIKPAFRRNETILYQR